MSRRRRPIRILASSAMLALSLPLVSCSSAAEEVTVAPQSPSPSAYSTDTLWDYPREFNESVLTSIPASMETSDALRLMAEELTQAPAFNARTSQYGGLGLDQLGPDVRLRITHVADLAEFGSATDRAAWENLRPTGERWVLLQDKGYSAGFTARIDPQSRRWEFWPDQESNGSGYLTALANAREVSPTFQTYILLPDADASDEAVPWAVFRFPTGEVRASPISLVPNFRWRMRGAPLEQGELYPLEYVLEPWTAD